VVLLGDSFHDASAEARLDPSDAKRLEALARDRALAWVVGNHDADGPASLPGQVVDRLDVEGLKLVHEPSPLSAPGEVAGHLHPCAKLVRYGRSVRRRSFLTDGERMVLPAFGAYAGGLNVLDEAFAALFPRAPVAAALGRGRVHALAMETLSVD
jgi:DNA ligase-associated metallophosphoesterase